MYQEKRVDRAVFRAYDIRGIIDDHFNEDAFYSIGRAIALRLNDLKRTHIFIARDGRLTSEALSMALAQGLMDSGIGVVNLGCVATPIMYYAAYTHEIDSGVMVTGSHNPSNYNGIKIVLAGKTLVQSDIDELYKLVQQSDFQHGKASINDLNIIKNYMTRIVEDIRLSRSLKVVVDCGNGVAGPVVPQVISAIGCEVISLHCEIDGRFPNHHPDPSVEENLADLKQSVLQHKADIGLAFDGDADRLGVVTNSGKVIWPDRLMMYYAGALLEQVRGATIVYDVKCSSLLTDVIKKAGGVAVMCPTGHSIVKGQMKALNAALAGEMSGHLFFKDRWYGFDDALYSACRLLEIMSQSALSLDEQFLTIPDSVNTPEMKIAIDEDKKFLFMQRFCEEARFANAEIIRIDGLRVEFSYGWGLVRASNTTACLVARFEAGDEESLADIQGLFKKELLRIDNQLILPF